MHRTLRLVASVWLIAIAGCVDDSPPNPFASVNLNEIKIPQKIGEFVATETTPDLCGLDLQSHDAESVLCNHYQSPDGSILVVMVADTPDDIVLYALSGCNYTSVQYCSSGTNPSRRTIDTLASTIDLEELQLVKHDNRDRSDKKVVAYWTFHDGYGWTSPENPKAHFKSFKTLTAIKVYIVADKQIGEEQTLDFLKEFLPPIDDSIEKQNRNSRSTAAGSVDEGEPKSEIS